MTNSKKIVGFGDSFMAASNGYFDKLVAKYTGIISNKFGISGTALFERYSGLRTLIDMNPTIFILQLAINDEWKSRNGVSNTVNNYKTDLAKAIDDIKNYTGAKVVVPQLLYYDISNYSQNKETRFAAWRDAIQEITMLKNVCYVDWHKAYYDAIQSGTTPSTLYAAYDDIHPSTMGHQILADTMFNTMESQGLNKYLYQQSLDRPTVRVART